MSPNVFFSALLLLVGGTARAAQRPTVVELFTSQGCSSCPPADEYLTELAQRADLLPLAFHVDYWDQLGWRDPYSLSAATQRQEVYARNLHQGPYTPQVVVDGTLTLVGSDRRGVAAAIERAQREGSEVGVSVSPGSALSIAVESGNGTGRVLLIGFDVRHDTAVRRGENAGRSLTDSNVVRSLRIVGQWTGQAVTFSQPMPEGEHAAVLLQRDDGRIVGAARLMP